MSDHPTKTLSAAEERAAVKRAWENLVAPVDAAIDAVNQFNTDIRHMPLTRVGDRLAFRVATRAGVLLLSAAACMLVSCCSDAERINKDLQPLAMRRLTMADIPRLVELLVRIAVSMGVDAASRNKARKQRLRVH